MERAEHGGRHLGVGPNEVERVKGDRDRGEGIPYLEGYFCILYYIAKFRSQLRRQDYIQTTMRKVMVAL